MYQVFLLVKVTLSMMEHNFYLIFQRLFYTLKILDDTEKGLSWKCKGLSGEKLTALATNDNSLSPSIK